MELLLVGDVMLGRLVNQVLRHAPPDYPWGDTLPVLRAADARMCNLECAVTDWGAPWSVTKKVFHFRTDARNVAALTAARIDAVSLANNHALDFEYEGMFETLRNLRAAGIACAGAGRDVAEASRPAVLERAGLRIGLIAFTDNEPDWEATADRPGIFHVPVDLRDPRARTLLETVAGARPRVDLLVVSAHWGPNWGDAPPAGHRPFARALLDAGADVVFGHSGHVVRGVEVYRGRPILYCTGDFVDDYAVDEVERNDRSFIFVLETDGARPRRLRLVPTLIASYQARLAPLAEARPIARRMQELCAELGTAARWVDGERHLLIEIA